MAEQHWTVVVPIRGPIPNFEKLLAALARQTYPPSRWDLVVVDDGSTEPVRLPPAGIVSAKLIRQEPRGPGPARNRGAAEARGDWVAFTAADCEPHPGWLEALDKASRKWPIAALGGRVECGLPGAAGPMTSHLLVQHFTTQLNRDPQDARFFTPNNLAVPLEGFRAIGGFGVGFEIGAGEDRDFCARWRESGRRLVQVPEAAVMHTHPLTVLGLLRQQYRYGRGSGIYRRNLQRRGKTVRFENPRFYAETLRAPWKRDTECGQPLLIAVLLGASLVANAVGNASECVSGK